MSQVPAIITIGNFDGVHLGHQSLIAAARDMARELGGRAVAISFNPHPAAVLRPGQEPPLLMTVEARRRAILEAGADEVILLTPAPEILSLSPDRFIDHLKGLHNLRGLVEGPDFRFGANRAGSVATLAELSRTKDFSLRIIEPLSAPLTDQLIAPVSSSLIRWLIGCGRVADAAICLGRAFSLEGLVIEGEKRGRTLGVPTANLRIDPQMMLPADGVYAGRADVDGRTHAAAISIGVKPTFSEAERTVEVHLLDFSGDLYGRRLQVQLLRWLRDQQRFPNLPSLKRQLEHDVGRAAHYQRLGTPAWMEPQWRSGRPLQQER